MPVNPTVRTRRGGWSIRRRLLVAYGVLAVATIAVLITGGLFLTRLDHAVNRRAGLLQPAEIHNAQLLTAMLDQETGVRGYAITGNAVNLQPYQQGLREQAGIAAGLRVQLAQQPQLLAALEDFQARATTWQDSYAKPLVALVMAKGPPSATSVDPLAGKADFDAIRAAAQRLDLELAQRTRGARTQVTTAFAVLLSLLALSLVVLAIAVISVYVATRRWVVVPLEGLSRDARAVAEGDLGHVVSAASAPPDVRDLADDVDAMRQRLLTEIASVEAARQEIAASEVLLRAQAGELERSNRDLEQFAYVASHDLQEPLRKVASFCQLLERRYAGQLDERGEQYIAFAVDGAKRMQQLIADLLAFSRVGRTTDTFAEVALSAPVTRAIAALSGSLEATGGHIEVGALPSIQGDLGLLTQLFQNLIGNALKFHGEVPPVVEVTAEQVDGEWLVSVADNGIGIEATYAEKVFVIFQRLHARDSSYAGTGIGLALCRRIAEFHHGRIWLDTDHAPPGAVFRLAFPVAPIGQNAQLSPT